MPHGSRRAPGIALVLVVVACTLLGDALQDALDLGRRELLEYGLVELVPPSNGISL